MQSLHEYVKFRLTSAYATCILSVGLWPAAVLKVSLIRMLKLISNTHAVCVRPTFEGPELFWNELIREVKNKTIKSVKLISCSEKLDFSDYKHWKWGRFSWWLNSWRAEIRNTSLRRYLELHSLLLGHHVWFNGAKVTVAKVSSTLIFANLTSN